MKRTFLVMLASAMLIFLPTMLFGEDIVHVIQKGDTLYSLSREYGVSVSDLCAHNGISNSSKIVLGQKIKIPQKNASKSSNQSASATYLVQAGDTLFSIARAYNTTVDEIRRANNMTEKSLLKSGSRIIIPSNANNSTIIASSNTSSNSASSAVNASTLPSLSTQNAAPLTDPRLYQTKAVDSKILWPVKTSELVYVAGKTNSVVLQGDKGENVTAVKAGKVIYSGIFRGQGLVVFVQPASSDYVYVYSGLDSVRVQKGDALAFGDVIGTLGIDTLNQKPQLSFMVFKNGTAIDPATAPRGA